MLAHPAFQRPGYQESVLATRGLIGYWRLDDSGATAIDLTRNKRHGSYTGSPAHPGGSAVRDGGSFLSASGKYASIPDDAAFTPNTTMSWMVWCRPSAAAFTMIAAKATYASAFEWGLARNTTDRFSAIAWQTNGNIHMAIDSAANSAPTGRWYCVGGSFTVGTRITVYINGVQSGTSTSVTGTTGDTTSPIYLGRRGGDTNWTYTGDIGDFAIWDRVLSDAEFASLYNEGVA